LIGVKDMTALWGASAKATFRKESQTAEAVTKLAVGPESNKPGEKERVPLRCVLAM
jgi:hypothetical protein